MDSLLPESLVPDLLDVLRQSGPAGAIAAAVIIGLVLAVIVFARAKDLWGESRGKSQSIEFQDRLLKLVDTLQASERALRQRIDDLSQENASKRNEVEELRVALALLRNQRRRLIDWLRKAHEGGPDFGGAQS